MRSTFFFVLLASAVMNAQAFSDYRSRYDHYADNDPAAFRYVDPYIAKAKREKNFGELSQAYKDAVSFSPDHKIAYADSMIFAASRTRDRDLLATAYLTKGTVYYFNYRKYKPALDEYLKAWQYAQHSESDYLYYKNLYHIGVVKSYLGYYSEALDIFEKCRNHFRKPGSEPEPPNIKYNRRKGYLNTLHQEAVCLLHLQQTQEAQAVLETGLAETGAEADYALERSYFYKLQGMIAYSQKRDSIATTRLTTALVVLEKKNDFTNAAIAYYYLGKSSARLGKTEDALRNFAKIDSVFRAHSFIVPEVRGSYEFLINYYHRTGDREQELYYTTQLLKADQIISADFKYLSGKIYREYDTQDLLESKKRLESSAPYFYMVIGVLLAASIGQALYLYRRKLAEKEIYRQYQALLLKAEEEQQGIGGPPVTIKRDHKISDRSLIKLLQKLETFEKSRLFLEKGLTRHRLAVSLETNESYLSKVINEYKENNFNGYLNGLRIQYITGMLRESSIYRSYSVEGLATAFGFADRTKFAKAFAEVNGMSPAEMIRELNWKAPEF